MCGRYVRTSPAEMLRAELGITVFADVDLRPRWNVCPGEDVAAVLADRDSRRLGALRWGIPNPKPKEGGRQLVINARSESVASRPAFRDSLRRRRCLVLADGFYEWPAAGKDRRPHFIRLRSGQPIAFAGLWQWQEPKPGSRVASCVILTCAANPTVAAVHDRMPVILDAVARERWLDPACDDPRALTSLLVPFPDGPLESYAVSTLVNSPRNDGPECVAPA